MPHSFYSIRRMGSCQEDASGQQGIERGRGRGVGQRVGTGTGTGAGTGVACSKHASIHVCDYLAVQEQSNVVGVERFATTSPHLS